MNAFTLTLGAFVLLHIGLSATGLRSAVVARTGEGPYRLFFALASVGLLVAMIMSFRAVVGDATDPLHQSLYTPPAWGRHAAEGVVLLGFLLGVAGLMTPGPTLAGAEGMIARENVVRGVLRITRHPFLWGVALWAFGHLLANGERYSVMLFGALGLMVLFGTRSIDRKGAARTPEAWARFSQATSNIPFAAIIQGRNRLVLTELLLPLLVALGVYFGVAWVHGALGRPIFGQ